jgi:hypothetical protein
MATLPEFVHALLSTTSQLLSASVLLTPVAVEKKSTIVISLVSNVEPSATRRKLLVA